MNQSSILVVSDMADLKTVTANNIQMLGREFMFSCRDGKQLNGWVPEVIYITERAQNNMSVDVRRIIDAKRSKGAQLCPVS
jgi:hypothetical protein